eukprot:jgi/Botrbrau1/16038/Bobra.7_2s0012.1
MGRWTVRLSLSAYSSCWFATVLLGMNPSTAHLQHSLNQNIFLHGSIHNACNASEFIERIYESTPCLICFTILVQNGIFQDHSRVCGSFRNGESFGMVLPIPSDLEGPQHILRDSPAHKIGPPFMVLLQATAETHIPQVWQQILFVNGYAQKLLISFKNKTPTSCPLPQAVYGSTNPLTLEMSLQKFAQSTADIRSVNPSGHVSLPPIYQSSPCQVSEPAAIVGTDQHEDTDPRHFISGNQPGTEGLAGTSAVDDPARLNTLHQEPAPVKEQMSPLPAINEQLLVLGDHGNCTPRSAFGHLDGAGPCPLPIPTLLLAFGAGVAVCCFMIFVFSQSGPKAQGSYSKAPTIVADVACGQTPRLETPRLIPSTMARTTGLSVDQRPCAWPLQLQLEQQAAELGDPIAITVPGCRVYPPTRWERTGLRLEKRFSVEE